MAPGSADPTVGFHLPGSPKVRSICETGETPPMLSDPDTVTLSCKSQPFPFPEIRGHLPSHHISTTDIGCLPILWRKLLIYITYYILIYIIIY